MTLAWVRDGRGGMVIAGRGGWMRGRFVAVAALCVAAAHPMFAEDAMRVGVLRPRLGSSTAMQRRLESFPQQYRAMAQESMKRITAVIDARAPLMVQRNWVEVLGRKGIPAVALDAETAEAGLKEAKEKNVRWLLTSTIDAEMGPAEGAATTVRGLQTRSGTNVKRALMLRMSMTDIEGRVFLPLRETSYTEIGSEGGAWSNGGDGAEGSSGGGLEGNLRGPHGKKDLWTECGDDLVATVASKLPLGAVKRVDAYTLLPKAPEMTPSVRFDVTVKESSTFKGKVLPADSGEGSRKSILEFAGGSVTTQDKGQGMIFTPGSQQLFLVDDRKRQYTTFRAADFSLVNAFGFGGGATKKGKLEKSGMNGKSFQYRLVVEDEGPEGAMTAQAMAVQGVDLGIEANVEIEFGEAVAGWEDGMKALRAFFAEAGRWPIEFSEENGSEEDEALTMAIWDEIAASPVPPRTISVRKDTSMRTRKKTIESGNTTQVSFDTAKIAKAVDFTIPSDYVWRPNPMLEFVFMR